MKKFLKALAAFAAIALLSTSFIACSDDDDDDPSVVATYLASYTDAEEGESGTYTISFYDNNTFVLHSKEVEMDKEYSILVTTDIDAMTGTYTGNPAKDGKIKVKALKGTKDEDDMTAAEALAFLSKIVEAAEKGATSFTFTNKDIPLIDIPASEQEEEEVTISNGKLTIEEVEFKRQ